MLFFYLVLHTKNKGDFYVYTKSAWDGVIQYGQPNQYFRGRIFFYYDDHAKPVNEDTIILGTYEGRKRAESILDDKNLVQTSTRRSSCGVNTTIGD